MDAIPQSFAGRRYPGVSKLPLQTEHCFRLKRTLRREKKTLHGYGALLAMVAITNGLKT